MKFATRENTKVGDTVLIPINNEWMEDEQICLEYEVVLALKLKSKDQIVGKDQEPLREFYEFRDDLAYLK